MTVERIEVIVEVIVEAIRTASFPGRTVYDGIFRGKSQGEFQGKPVSDGDLEHIRDQPGVDRLLLANRSFPFSPDRTHGMIVLSRPDGPS